MKNSVKFLFNKSIIINVEKLKNNPIITALCINLFYVEICINGSLIIGGLTYMRVII